MAQDAFGNETPATIPSTGGQPSGTAFDDFPEKPPETPAAPKTEDESSVFDTAPVVTSNDHGVLSMLKGQSESAYQAGKGMVAGAGTTLGEVANPQQWKDIVDVKGQTPSTYWQRQKDDFGKLLNTSAIILDNAVPDIEQARKEHPHMEAVIQGASTAVQGLTTPASIAMIVGTSGIGEIPAIVEKAFAGSEALAPYAPKAAYAAARSLQALGVYFTGSQIAQVLTQVPEVAKAVMTGQTDKAVELSTNALINGAVAYTAGKATIAGIREFNETEAAKKATGHKDYNDIVHKRAGQLVTGGGMKDQIANLGTTVAPNLADREWTTEYVEAGRDRAEMARKQNETKNGPTPVQQIDANQSGTKPGVQPISEIPKTTRVFHGTNGDVENIEDLNAMKHGRPGAYGTGVYLSADPAVAGNYAGPANVATGGRVVAGDLKDVKLLDADKPLPADVKEALVKKYGDQGEGYQNYLTAAQEDAGELSPKAQKEMQKIVAGVGYKGITADFHGSPGILLYPEDVTGEPLKNILTSAVPQKSAIADTEGKSSIAYKPIKIGDQDYIQASRPDVVDAKGNPVTVTLPTKLTPEEREVEANRLFQQQKDFVANRAAAPSAAPAEKAGVAKEDRTTQIEGINADTGAQSKRVYTPSAQEALALQSAVKDAQVAAAKHVITPDERAKMAAEQDPTRKITPAHEKAIDFVMKQVKKLGSEAQKRGLLKPDAVRDNYVSHEWDYDDSADPLRHRLFDDYHSGQQAGHVAKNKDYFALMSDYAGKMMNRIADADTVNDLYKGRTKDGAPLAVPGGFVEGQRVSSEGPQSHVMNDTEVKKFVKNGQMPEMIRSGRVIYDPEGKTYTMKADDYKKADNLYQLRPIGPTPIPSHIVDDMKGSGTLDDLMKKGLIIQNKDGNYVSTQPLWSRTPVYLHPDIADHFNGVVKPTTEEPTSKFGRLGKLYDDYTGNMKSLLLSWSPFHKVRESTQMMEAMGLFRGGKLAAQTNRPFSLPSTIDYFNLTPNQAAAIRDGIVVADPRGNSMSNVEEGLGAGEGNSWGNKTYKVVDKVLEKLKVPANIRDKINLQNILTKDVFGPQGMITRAKFQMYDYYKPQIMEQMRTDHPGWSPEELDKQAGRQAASFSNNKFGGLNQVLLGRTLKDQRVLRRVLLAPDFLESNGRSLLDLVNPYSGNLVSKLIQFNIAHALTAGAINYALHRDPNDHTIKGAIDATHMIDHPFEVVSYDGKTAYGLRTSVTDFMHMLNRPREFAYDRLNPAVRAGEEIATQRNAYGRKEPLGESLEAIPKAAVPIQVQNAVGLGSKATTEPTAGQQFMKSVGVQARPNRTPAEQLAIDKMSSKLSGTEALVGNDLLKQQLKFQAEDKLRAAIQQTDPDTKQKAIANAQHDIDMLAARKIITPQEKKNISTDAKGTRLKSTFVHMDPNDALDIWDAANDEEKDQLGVAMQAHFMKWKENLQKKGERIGQLSEPYQKIFDRFKAASTQLAQLREQKHAEAEIKAQAEQETGTAFDDFKPGVAQ